MNALYHLEWDTHDEGGAGTYRFLGDYERTGALMFQRVSRSPRERVMIYLFPHEIQYVGLLSRDGRKPPQAEDRKSEPRARASSKAPALRAGRVLGRGVRQSPNTWEVGIVGPAIARAARFVGFRNIDGDLFAVWTEGHMLYAQPWSA